MADLNDADVDAVMSVIGDAVLMRMDTKMGTVQAVKFLKEAVGTWGAHGGCEDGPFSDGTNAEYWSRAVERVPAGFDVRVTHTVRATDTTTVLRSGRVHWNQVANHSTSAAYRLQHAASDRDEVAPGQQASLF